MQEHRVVIVGGGFGGLYCENRCAKRRCDVTLVDRRNFHLFQPLLYQVATGGLSPANIAAPLRAVLKRQKNAEVLLAEVVGFDLTARGASAAADGDGLAYDSLIVAERLQDILLRPRRMGDRAGPEDDRGRTDDPPPRLWPSRRPSWSRTCAAAARR